MAEVVISNADLPDCCALCFAYGDTCNLLTEMSDDVNIWKERDKNCPLGLLKDDIEKRSTTKFIGSQGIDGYRCGTCERCGMIAVKANFCMWCGRKNRIL